MSHHFPTLICMWMRMTMLDMVDEGMDDMMDALFTHTHIEAHVMSKPERGLRDLHICPLWEGTSMSKLRACLEILNLQATYGWSDTSVSALMRYMYIQR